MLTNAEIAERLREIRTLMEFAGEPFFKFMAYERAAETLENAAPLGSDVNVERLHRAARRREDDRRSDRERSAATGTEPYLDELRARYPSTLLEVLGVQGVGMKTAQQLFERLGIASLADLERALDERCAGRDARGSGPSRSRTSGAGSWPRRAARGARRWGSRCRSRTK